MRLKLIYILMLLCVSAGALAQNTAAQEEKKARLEREIAIIDKQLAENASMREQIREAVTAGLPTIAECGGFLYLSAQLEEMADAATMS